MALVGRNRWIPAIVLVAVTASAGLAGAEPATPPNQSQQQLLDEVRALRAEVEALKSGRSAPVASLPAPGNADNTQRGLGDISGLTATDTAAAVQKDADNRGIFHGAALAAITGFDGKSFVLSDESGNNVLRPGVIIQVRNVTNWREGGKGKTRASADDVQNGWEIRRAKLFFVGNLFTPELTYKFQIANSTNSSAFSLDDAWMAYRFYSGSVGKMSFRVGQFKPPVVREEFEVGDEKQMAVERSLLNDSIGGVPIGPRAQGIDLLWNSPKDLIHTETMLHDGAGNTVAGGASRPVTSGGRTTNVVYPGNVVGSANTDYRDLHTAGTPQWGVAGRFEYKFAGDWTDYVDFTARATKNDLLIVAISGDFTEAHAAHYTHFSADLQYKSSGGLSVYVAGIGAFTEFSGTPGFNNNFDYGALVQVGYAIKKKIEPYIRVAAIKYDDDILSSNHLVSEFQVGVNYFLGEGGKYGHHAKFTLAGTYLPVGSGPVDHLSTDELATGGRNEALLTAQFQLWL